MWTPNSWLMAVLMVLPCAVHAQKAVPTVEPTDAKEHVFRDSKYGVRFVVPPGWSLNRRDGQVSTFRLDARSAGRRSELRSVASLEFNPYPMSTLSGALLYYSVARRTNDRECERQATGQSTTIPGPSKRTSPDVQTIGGMPFAHGHDEHGGICVEARDEVYTAFRKGSCYRFDLAINMFCSVTSGAEELSRDQMHDLERRMTAILSTVVLDWEKSGPTPVPVPEDMPRQKRNMLPEAAVPSVAMTGH